MFEFGKKGSQSEGEQMQERASTMARETPSAPGQTERGASRGGNGGAVIGRSIHIEGDVRGEEDLFIDGHVQGTVTLKSHALTIGSQGRVQANLYAKSVRVEGRVEGDLYGAERVVITASAQVTGNVMSPRVSLEDGARFKGSIDMDPEALQPVFGTGRGAGSAADTVAAGKAQSTSTATTKPSA